MINGAHAIIYSKDPESDRAFLRDVLGLPYVDVGEGWLIFGLPPAEVAVHPAGESGRQELYFMCEDVGVLAAELRRRGTRVGRVRDEGWGLITDIRLPGGGKIGVYEPRHARPKQIRAKAVAARPNAGRALRPRAGARAKPR